MKFTLDTLFFGKLKEEEKKESKKLWGELTKLKHRAFIPTVVISEVTYKIFPELDHNDRRELGAILSDTINVEEIGKRIGQEEKELIKDSGLPLAPLKKMPNITLVNMDCKIASKAGNIKRIYNIPIADSIIIASHMLNDRSSFIVTDDERHFKKIRNLDWKPIEKVV